MNSVPVTQRSGVESITITSASGRVYRLGDPTARFFIVRVWFYRLRRYMEQLKCQM